LAEYGMSYKIRLATAYDIDQIYEIEKMCFNTRERFDKNYFYLFLIRRNFEIFFVATQENKRNSEDIIGFIVAFLNKTGNYEIATINVHPEFRNLGIGFDLMMELERTIKLLAPELIQSKKLDESTEKIMIELTVHDQNNAAISLYSKLDYQVIETRDNYYQDGKNGIRMMKSLELK
jgi:ribosomal protein S18 acetylase RimI-like enzyme